MTDITPDLNISLKEKGSTPILKHTHDIAKLNTFLQEAYSIASSPNARITDLTTSLRGLRPAYLSTAPPPRHVRRNAPTSTNPSTPTHLTDTDRDAIDAQSKTLLHQLNTALTNLAQASTVRFDTAESLALSRRSRGGFGAIGRWAAGGAVTAQTAEEEREERQRRGEQGVREGVVAFLRGRLEEAGRLQGGMMEVRLGREVERGRSVLYKSGMGTGSLKGDSGEGWAVDEKGWGGEGEGGNVSGDWAEALNQEQAQVFAQENSAMMEHYQDQLSHVHQAERSILEISELHSTLHANLEQQNAHIEQLVQDSYTTEENVGKGNRELKRASERKSTAQAVFWGTMGFCSFLVVWDLVF